MLWITLASTSPLAPLVWLGIVVGVVGAAVWHNASKADPFMRRRRELPPRPEPTERSTPRRSPSVTSR